jgi:tetratricopeptide (TPR) repeat protein
MLTEMQDRDAIVSNAIKIASAEVREAYIAGACGDDVVLRRQVEELVAAHFAASPGPRPPRRDLEQAGADPTGGYEAQGAQTRTIQGDLMNESMEAKKMGPKKPRGLRTVGALLLLPVALGGAGLTVWKLRAEDLTQTTLQQVTEERDQARKAEAELKKQLEQVTEARQVLAEEREKALAAEKEARRSAEDAKAVLDFLRDHVFLAAGHPTSWSREGLGKDVTLRKAVEVAAAKVTGAFPDRPMVEASIREILGASYLDLGEAEQAVKQYEQAFQLREKWLGPDHPATGDCRNKLAVAYREAGRTDEASRLYDLNTLDNKAQEALRVRNPARGRNPASQGARN